MKFTYSITGCFCTHVVFPYILHLRLRSYASAKQGLACLPCTSSFPVHVAMSSLHESRSGHLQTLSNAVYPSVALKDENLTAPDQDYMGDGGVKSNQIFNYSSLFVMCITHRRHFHRLLQRRYLSVDRVLTHMCAINISVAISEFSHCYLYSGMRTKMWGITF